MSTPSRYVDLPSRAAYGKALTDLAEKNDRIVALSADLAASTGLKEFTEKYPDRFFNIGIAEQNMYGIAAGMALSGKIPFASTFATFASLRAAEQVRTDIAYGNVPVRVVGTHQGVGLAPAGPTHHALEDIGVMRCLANMTIINPADSTQAAMATAALVDFAGPAYLRLSRPKEATVYTEETPFVIGKADIVRDGKDISIIACGGMVGQSLLAAELLATEGIQAQVINMSTIKPIDKDAIIAGAEATGAILTVEEHNIFGGLGSAVAEVIAEAGLGIRFLRWGIQDIYTKTGEYPELLKLYELDGDGIAAKAKSLLA